MKAGISEFEDRLQIVCPHCGGTGSWKLLQSLNRCGYCGSILYRIHREDVLQYLVADSSVGSDDQIIDVLATYDAMRIVSQRRAQLHNYDDSSAMRVELGSGFNDVEVYYVRDQRKPLFGIVQSYTVHVPYLLYSSTLVFHVLGRISGGMRKVYRPLFFTAEDITPAYSHPWDFRDKGLALSLDKLRPFQPEMQRGSEFLEPVQAPANQLQPARQWKMQRSLLTREIDPICFEGAHVLLRRWIAFRPYAYVNARTPEGERWFLIDKQFGTIAGDPKPDEIDRIRKKQSAAFTVTKSLLLQIKAVAFRCPECGWDIEMDKRSSFQICRNCTRVLEMTEQGLRPCDYRVVDSASGPDSESHPSAWLPFWRCNFRITLEGTSYENISDLIRRIIPVSSMRTTPLPDHWNAIFLPAFESWTYDRYDQWAFMTAAHFSQTSEESLRDEMLLHFLIGNDAVVPPFYPTDMVEALLPRVLPYYFPVTLQSQLNTRLLNGLAKMQMTFRKIELTYAPVRLEQTQQEGLRLAGPSGSIEFRPLQTGEWPHVLYRSVRRWKSLAAEAETT